MTHLIRRTLAAGAFAALGLAGLATPAQADTSELGCDPAVVTAAVDAARADVVTARKAYTSFVKQGTKPEKAEKPAKGDKPEKGGKGSKSAKGTKPGKAGKAARDEARKAARAEREALKTAWDAAKAVLEELEAHAAGCAEVPTEEPVEEPVEEPETDEPETDEPTV